MRPAVHLIEKELLLMNLVKKALIIVAMLLALATVISTVTTVSAADKGTLLEGTLVDSKCYLMDNKDTGNDHGGMKGCGTMCLKGGNPAALVTKDKKFYALIVAAPVLASYVGQTLRVHGTLYGTALNVDKAEVLKDGKWVTIDIGQMM
jgi:hypothetical protein